MSRPVPYTLQSRPTYPKNPALRHAIIAAGGIRAVAKACHRTPAAVYLWLSAGRVTYVVDALRLAEFAAAAGHHVTIGQLAGMRGRRPIAQDRQAG